MQPEWILAQYKNGLGSASHWLDDIRGARLLRCGVIAAFGSVASLQWQVKAHQELIDYSFRLLELSGGLIVVA